MHGLQLYQFQTIASQYRVARIRVNSSVLSWSISLLLFVFLAMSTFLFSQ